MTNNDLTLLSVGGRNRNGRAMCRVRCKCGKTRRIQLRYFRSGHTKSCGCAKQSVYPKWSIKHGHHLRDKKSPTYVSWSAMLDRINNPKKFPAHANVRVSERWSDPENGFSNFLADLGPRPPNTTLGRFCDITDYMPGECCWMTNAEQQQHKAIKRKFTRAVLRQALREGAYAKTKERRRRR